MHFLLEPGDLAGGDLRPGNVLGDLDWGPIPESALRTLDGVDHFQLTFIPTESALACSGTVGNAGCGLVSGTTTGKRDHVSCDAVCRTANRNAFRFDNVLSNPDNVNNVHSSIHLAQAKATLAYFYEYGLADKDGLFGASNPFLIGGVPPDGEALDCNDAIPEGAPCDGPDGDLCNEGVFHCGTTPQCSDVSGTNQEVCNGVDDDCDGQIDEGLAGQVEWCNFVDDNCDGAVDASCSLSTQSCPNQSAIFNFTATQSQLLCQDEGLCSNASCDSKCRNTAVLSGCNGNTTACPGGTTAKYTSGTLIGACIGNSPSVCRCQCTATGATYQQETTTACLTCGNGVCDGGETCDTCPGDCPRSTINLTRFECVICDATGEMLCGPGMFQWCCPN